MASITFPETVPYPAREAWERTASTFGFISDHKQEVMERFPQQEDESDLVYSRRVEAIRRHEASLQAGLTSPSQNARTHGLSGRIFRLAAGEDQAEYDRRVDDAFFFYGPVNSEEIDHVVNLVNATWLLARVQGMASDLMIQGMEEGTRIADGMSAISSFNTISRYEGTLNRTIDKCRRRLREIKEDRKRRQEAATFRTPSRPGADAESQASTQTRFLSIDPEDPYDEKLKSKSHASPELASNTDSISNRQPLTAAEVLAEIDAEENYETNCPDVSETLSPQSSFPTAELAYAQTEELSAENYETETETPSRTGEGAGGGPVTPGDSPRNKNDETNSPPHEPPNTPTSNAQTPQRETPNAQRPKPNASSMHNHEASEPCRLRLDSKPVQPETDSAKPLSSAIEVLEEERRAGCEGENQAVPADQKTKKQTSLLPSDAVLDLDRAA